MRSRAEHTAPEAHVGLWLSPEQFFRSRDVATGQRCYPLTTLSTFEYVWSGWPAMPPDGLPTDGMADRVIRTSERPTVPPPSWPLTLVHRAGTVAAVREDET
jgi:hypothetical protein